LAEDQHGRIRVLRFSPVVERLAAAPLQVLPLASNG